MVREGAVLPVEDAESRGVAAHRNDPQSIPGWEDAISCSIEYPNAWYWRQVRDRHPNYKDWVALLIDSVVLGSSETGFCRRNAAAADAHIARGIGAFRAMYEEETVGARGVTFRRGASRLPACPTDDQAEVLIRGGVPWSRVFAVVVETPAQAATEHARLEVAGAVWDGVKWVVCPEFFQPTRLSGMIRRGERPEETLWKPN